MSKERIRHLFQLLTVIAVPVLTIWGDAQTDLASKIALSFAAVLALAFEPSKRGEIAHVVLGVSAVLVPVLTFVLAQSSMGAKAGAVVAVAIAVLTKLQKALGSAQTGALLLLLAMFAAGHARAADSQFGGCFAGGQLCAGPSATVTLGTFDLATQKFAGGVSPGLGYGLTYAPDRWYAVGLAGYLAFSVGGGQPNSAKPAVIASFANYLRLGAAYSIAEQSVGTLRAWSLVFGVGADFGGTPTYAGRAP